MKFALLDTDQKEFHEGVTFSQKEPAVLIWSTRAFVRKDSRMDQSSGRKIVRYAEVEAHRIG